MGLLLLKNEEKSTQERQSTQLGDSGDGKDTAAEVDAAAYRTHHRAAHTPVRHTQDTVSSQKKEELKR